MMIEGSILGGLPALSQRYFRGRVWLIVLVTLLCDRLVLFFLVYWLAPILKLPSDITADVVVLKGLPGFILLLIFIPIIVTLFLSYRDRTKS